MREYFTETDAKKLHRRDNVEEITNKPRAAYVCPENVQTIWIAINQAKDWLDCARRTMMSPISRNIVDKCARSFIWIAFAAN